MENYKNKMLRILNEIAARGCWLNHFFVRKGLLNFPFS